MNGPQRSKERQLAFHPDDAQEFGDALRERFPAIRFRDHHTCRKKIRGKIREIEYREVGSLCDPDGISFHVWIEPENWKPVWGKSNEYGERPILNQPRLHFAYDKSAFLPPTYTELRPGRIWAYYAADDREHKRFLDAVWRMVAKMSSNVFDVIDMKTGEINRPNQRWMMFAGHHALEWCRADPQRRLDQSLRPADGYTTPPARMI